MFKPSLFIDIGADNHFYTLRETYLHTTYVRPGEMGNAIVNGVYQGTIAEEVRSFHHFNLSQNPEDAIAKAKSFAESDFNILIQGETGTGKELFAHAIHNASNRKRGPFITVNCMSLSESLLESELFGYEPGAFTGSKREGKIGLFELCHNGTLFIDEIGELSPSVQVKILRFIEEKEIVRVGGNTLIPVNVRIITATNRNIKNDVSDGKFRLDFFKEFLF